MYKTSKEYSDIPDFIGGSPKKGKFGRKAADTPKKSKDSDDNGMDDEDDSPAPSTSKSPAKATKRKSDDDEQESSPSKRVRIPLNTSKSANMINFEIILHFNLGLCKINAQVYIQIINVC